MYGDACFSTPSDNRQNYQTYWYLPYWKTKIVSPCSFKLHFSCWESSWTCFHRHTSHVYFLFYELSMPMFCPFSIRLLAFSYNMGGDLYVFGELVFCLEYKLQLFFSPVDQGDFCCCYYFLGIMNADGRDSLARGGPWHRGRWGGIGMHSRLGRLGDTSALVTGRGWGSKVLVPGLSGHQLREWRQIVEFIRGWGCITEVSESLRGQENYYVSKSVDSWTLEAELGEGKWVDVCSMFASFLYVCLAPINHWGPN